MKPQKNLVSMATELEHLGKTRTITLASNEAQLLFVLHRRLVETLAYGEPRTPLPSTHHA